MALDKQKALDSAQKFLQKGQIDKAILEYRKVCEADPDDLRSLQKLGDLYSRQGSRQEAIATYMKLADLLVAKGFANRAVSIYKQVLQLNPLLVPVYVKLSELFKELVLSKDARIFNQRAIEILQKTGNQDDLLALLRRVVEGDPEDAISRINLAETCLRVGDTAGAVRELEASLPLLREQKLDDLFIRAAERLLYHNPDNLPLCKELSLLHLRRKEVPRAMKLLLFCRKRDPEDLETMELLANHFIASGTGSKATLVLLEKVRLHRKRGEDGLAASTCRKILQFDPDNDEARNIIAEVGADLSPEPVESAPSTRAAPPEDRDSGAEIPIFEDSVVGRKRPSTTPASRDSASVGVPGANGGELAAEPGPEPEPEPVMELEPGPADEDDGEIVVADPVTARFLEESDVFLKYGLNDKAVEHLIEGMEKSLTPLVLHEKLKDVYLDLGQMDLAVKQLFVLAEGWQAEKPAAAIHALKEILLLNPTQPRAMAMLEALQGGVPSLPPASQPAIAEEALEISPVPSALPPQAAEPLEPLPLVQPVQAGEFHSFLEEETSDVLKPLPEVRDWDIISTEEVKRDEGLVAPPPLPDLEPELPDEPLRAEEFGETGRALDAVSLPEFHLEDVDTLETETEEIYDSTTSVQPVEVVPPPLPVPAIPPVPPPPDLDDLFPALGLAAPTPPPLPAARPPAAPPARPAPRPAPAAKLPPTPTAKPPAVTTAKPAAVKAAKAPAVPAAKPPAGPAPGAVEAALEEVEFFIQQGLLQEARLFLEDMLAQYPGNRLILDRLSELDAPAGDAAVPGAEAMHLFMAPPEAIMAVPASASADESDSQITDEAFDALNAIESIIQVGNTSTDGMLGSIPTEIDASDARSHYDLGIAYMEMDVFESAVQEFRVASQAVEMEALCYNMIGLCFMKQGRVDDAIKEYKLGLFAKVKSQDQELNLYYDIAEAYIKAGDQREAMYYLQNIKKKDPGFKDVKLKLIALSSSYKPSARPAPAPEPKPAAKGKADSSKEVDAAFDDLFGDFGGKG